MTDIVFSEINKGHWNIVILMCLALAIFMALKRYVTMNEVRHKEHTHLDKMLGDNLTKLTTITEVHEAEINGLKEDVKDVRAEVRGKKNGR